MTTSTLLTGCFRRGDCEALGEALGEVLGRAGVEECDAVGTEVRVGGGVDAVAEELAEPHPARARVVTTVRDTTTAIRMRAG